MLRQVVILVGGRGTRLGALTEKIPKPLLPVAGKPFLDYIIRHYARHGLTNIVLLAGHYGEKIETYYRENPVEGANITVIIEQEALGTAGCLKYAQDHLENSFILTNGDSLFDFNVLALLDDTSGGEWLVKLALRRIEKAGRFGQVELAPGGWITSFTEKTTAENEPALINGGVYLLRKGIIDLIDEMPCSMEMDIFPKLIENGRLHGQEFSGYFIDIGIPESYERAQTEIPAHQKRPAVFFDRDGTLNRDDGYTHKPEELEWMPGAPEAIRLCNDKGYFVFVVTNQSGIARGFYDVAAVNRFHAHMQQQLQPCGAHIDAFEFCPHHVDGKIDAYTHACTCRKPETGMLEKLTANWPINLEGSLLIGDKDKDMESAIRFGVRGIRYIGENLAEGIAEVI